MIKKRAYKNLLAVAVLTAVSGSCVLAADMTYSDTKSIGGTQKKTAATIAAEQDAAAAEAISAARGGISEAQKADAEAAKQKELDNSSLATKDKAVLTVTNAGGDNLQAQQAAGVTTPITTPQAQYYTGVTDEQIQPYVGRTITGITIQGLEPSVAATAVSKLPEKIGDKLSINGVKSDIVTLGSSGVISEIHPVFTNVPEGVKINYNVTLNPVVKAVEFEGNTIYSSDMLRKYMQVQPGTVLNTVAVGERIQGINAAYQREGYMMAHVTDMTVDKNGTLHVVINEGTVEDIVVHGNKKTKDYVILREFNQKKGQPFNKFLVRRSIEKVYNLGYFDDVNVRLLEGSTPDKIVIEVDVLEHKTGTITLGAGYSDSDGMVGIVEVGEDNLRGTGDKVKVHWEFGGTAGYRNYSVSYLRPWIDDKATSLGVTIFDRRDAYTDYDGHGNDVSEYVKGQKGFNISLGRQTGEFTRDYLTLESRKDSWIYDSDNMSGYRYDLGSDYAYNNGYDFAKDNYIGKNFGRTNSATWQKVYDSRDNIYDPTRGRRISTTVQWAGHGFGGDFDYYKFTGEYRTYKSIGKGQVLAFRARLGFAQGDVPYSQLFTVGGADSLRGYEDDQFRGKKMYNATVEYRVPLFNKVSGVLFTDIGDAWDAPNVLWYKPYDKTSFNVGVGAGIRVTTPIGPIRLDYGIGKNDRKFHFSFGGQF